MPDLTGATLTNYTVSKVNGTLTVTTAALTITAGDATREYGDANPTFSTTVTGAKNGETFTESATTVATAQKAPTQAASRGRWPASQVDGYLGFGRLSESCSQCLFGIQNSEVR